MSFLNPKESLINVTEKMSSREKFAYVNISKAAIVSLSRNSDTSFPNFFAKNVVTALKMQEQNIFKAVSHSLVDDIKENRQYKIGLHKNGEYYYSNIFEYYYMNHKDNYSAIIDYYIRSTPTVVVSFHDRKTVNNHLGYNLHVINVPYNNYYQKIDDVYAQLSELDAEGMYCIMDCGVLGLALLPKIWNNLNMSILDFGKTLSLAKSNRGKLNVKEDKQLEVG